LLYVKHFKTNFFGAFHTPVDAVETLKKSPFFGGLYHDAITLPANSKSAMKPPLANEGGGFKRVTK